MGRMIMVARYRAQDLYLTPEVIGLDAGGPVLNLLGLKEKKDDKDKGGKILGENVAFSSSDLIQETRFNSRSLNLELPVQETVLSVICCHISSLHGLKRPIEDSYCCMQASYADQFEGPLSKKNVGDKVKTG